MARRVGAGSVLLALLASGCLRVGQGTGVTTEDIAGVRKPEYPAGVKLTGQVLRTNPFAQMITLAVDDPQGASHTAPGDVREPENTHGSAPAAGEHGPAPGGHHAANAHSFPVEGDAVGALRTLWPGGRVTVTCRQMDTPSLERRAHPDAAAGQADRFRVSGAYAGGNSPNDVGAPPALAPAGGPPAIGAAAAVATADPSGHASASPAAAGHHAAPPAAVHHAAPPANHGTPPANHGTPGGGAVAGLTGLAASCPSVIHVEALGH